MNKEQNNESQTRVGETVLSLSSHHLNNPATVVSLAHDDLSADKQSQKTQTHHDQYAPVKGNLAY